MFYKDKLFSNSNIYVDMVNLCSFFRGGGVFFGGGGVNICIVKKNVFFFSWFFNKIINNINICYIF